MEFNSAAYLEDRMSAIMEETMVEKTECGAAIIEANVLEKMEMPLKTKRGEELYQRFCAVRAANRKQEYEEDIKIRDLFLKIGREQAEKAEAELYNKENEGQILNTIIEEKSGLQEAFEEMVAIRDVMEPLYTKNEIRDIVRDIMATKTPLSEEEVKQLQDEEDARRLKVLERENSKF